MKDRYFYMADINTTTTIEFGTRKCLLDMIKDFVDQIKFANEVEETVDEALFMGRSYYVDTDCMVAILYKDGTETIIEHDSDSLSYRKTNIESIVYSDGYQTIVYGNFEINEYGCVTTSRVEIVSENIRSFFT